MWLWGHLSLPAQVTLLTMGPLLALAGVEVAVRRARIRRLAPLFALAACGAAWAALVFGPRALDLPFSSLLLWPGVGFGLAVATSYGFRIVAALSLAVFVIAAASVFFVSGGTPWTLVFERLEPFTGSAFVLALVAGRLAAVGEGARATARRTGLALGFGGLLALSTRSGTSLLPVAPETALASYRFVAALAVIALLWRLRRTRRAATRTPVTPAPDPADASRLVVAALVLLLSMGGLLGVARWNRGGEPQFIVLTERELVPRGAGPGDSSAASSEPRLVFRWAPREDAQDARAWLTDGRLNRLGFSTEVAAGAPAAAQFYGRSLPRDAWVAFELDGPAWRVIEQRRAVARPTGPADTSGAPSRLVPIDAAPNPDALRRRYAGQPVVVLPAVIEMRYEREPLRGASVWGRVARLVSPDVSIPVHLRARLTAGPRPPTYAVVLGVGRLGAVWVHDMRAREAIDD